MAFQEFFEPADFPNVLLIYSLMFPFSRLYLFFYAMICLLFSHVTGISKGSFRGKPNIKTYLKHCQGEFKKYVRIM